MRKQSRTQETALAGGQGPAPHGPVGGVPSRPGSRREGELEPDHPRPGWVLLGAVAPAALTPSEWAMAAPPAPGPGVLRLQTRGPHLEAWPHCSPVPAAPLLVRLCGHLAMAVSDPGSPGRLFCHSPGAGAGGSWEVEPFGNFEEYSKSFSVTQGALPFLYLKSFGDRPASPPNISPWEEYRGGGAA